MHNKLEFYIQQGSLTVENKHRFLSSLDLFVCSVAAGRAIVVGQSALKLIVFATKQRERGGNYVVQTPLSVFVTGLKYGLTAR